MQGNLLLVEFYAFRRLNKHLNVLASDWIRRTNSFSEGNTRHFQSDTLDLGGQNFLSANIDQVTLSARDPEIFAIDRNDVFCVIPSLIVKRGRRVQLTDHS